MPDVAALPTADELKRLPLRAIVAYAVRCAKRCQPIVTLSGTSHQTWEGKVKDALTLAESYCLGEHGGVDARSAGCVAATLQRELGESGNWAPALAAKAAALAARAVQAAARWRAAENAGETDCLDDACDTANIAHRAADAALRAVRAIITAAGNAREQVRKVAADYAERDAWIVSSHEDGVALAIPSITEGVELSLRRVARMKRVAYLAAAHVDLYERAVEAAFTFNAADLRDDFDSLLSLNLGVFPGDGQPIDPGEAGPLGPFVHGQANLPPRAHIATPEPERD
jgi:hypothetical protein